MVTLVLLFPAELFGAMAYDDVIGVAYVCCAYAYYGVNILC
jgi:hypothetical protein